MGKLVVSENTSIDGIVQDPTGEEGFQRGGWFLQVSDADREAWATVELREVQDAAALLLGRRSYEFFAARWPPRTGALADRLNSMPKYVVSSTLLEPGWTNTKVLTGDVAGHVSRLTQELTGEVVVYASIQLVRLLMKLDLVDELRLMVYPVVLGSGERLFAEMTHAKPMRLIDARIVGEGLAHFRYQTHRDD